MTLHLPLETPDTVKAERDRLKEILAALGSVSASPGMTQALMDETVARVMQLTRAGGAVLEIADGDEMEYRAASGSVSGHVGLRLKAATSLSGLCAAQKRAISCPDTEADPRVDLDACRKIGARSMLVVPLQRGGEAMGVLMAVSARPGAFDQIDEHALELFAQFIGGVVARQVEIDRSAQLAADMQRRALSDDLTRLPNRAAWNEALHMGIARARRARIPLAVMYIDLNGFKAINDRHGHAAGDALLRAFASQLRGCVRVSDFVARLAGDEFAVLIEGLDDVERSVPIVVNRVLDAVCSGILWEKSILVCLPSMGVAYQDGPDYDATALMRNADEAMYRAKHGHMTFTVTACA